MARILIAEDDLITLYLLQHNLAQEEHEVIEIAAHGDVAAEAARELKPDIILMDINLKGYTSGIETMEKIRETSDVPVIFISATIDKAIIKKALSINNAQFLSKPIDSGVLESTIREMSGSKFCYE